MIHLSIEVALLISGVSLAFGIYHGVSNMKRNQTFDTRKDASEMTTVIVKLENICAGISEIKNEMSNVKNDVRESRERIILIEESTKQAHKRMDGFEKHNKRSGDQCHE